MRWKFIAKTIGLLLMLLGGAMALPLAAGYLFKEQSRLYFIAPMGITWGCGLILLLVSRNLGADTPVSQREGMATVTFAWAAVGLFGALPFYMSPGFDLFTDAFFESVSGFTTTGSSVMTRIEGFPRSILLWRSLIQWLGGMGIIVLSLAVLPFLGAGGIQLYKAEVPSPVPDKLTPRLSDSAKILWMVYILFTVMLALLLLAGGMPLFESICHALTTLPTGGFSPMNASVAHYDSAYFDYVIFGFMVLAGINFSLHFQLLRGRPLAFWQDSECRFYLGLTLCFTLLITWDLYATVYSSFGDAFRFASFQVASILTTTGFATADYENWPGLSQVLLFTCMLAGASAGSTGGGIKCARIIVCFKYCYRELFKILHPRSVRNVLVDNIVVPEPVLQSVMAFLGLYMGLFFLAGMGLAAMGIDMVTAFSAVAACIGNIGPGFGLVGPTDNFAHLPAMAKWLLSWCMLAGRLEIYTVIILLVPEFWRK